MELYKGRPQDTSDRSDKEIRVYDFLDGLAIEYYRLDHAPAFGSEEELCRDIEESLGARICKNLFLANRQRTRFYMLMIPGHKVFRSSDISKQAGSSRLHFAESEYMEDLIGCSPGSASVMGLINDSEHKVQLLVDDDVINSEYVGCHPCINTSSLRIRSEDIFDKFVKATGHDFIIVHAE